MAIDSAVKRRAVSGVPSAFVGPGVTPTAASTAFSRYASGWSYNAAGGGGGGGGGGVFSEAAVTLGGTAQIQQPPGTIPVGGI
jgi:hypothetical protein